MTPTIETDDLTPAEWRELRDRERASNDQPNAGSALNVDDEPTGPRTHHDAAFPHDRSYDV